ncbi:hypothetical protein GYMLUDRAFT_241037 [Collybiopsis luxurians FD-317 M1]|nr:hypothetical protein GYMLUDRAFT_241037 [Collybiopsis luxurians FD-317 M1]
MQHSDARPQWGHYYPVVPNGFYPRPSVPQGYPTQSQNYHAGHGSVHGGSVVASPSTDVTLYPLQAVRSLRDPFEGDHFPPTGKPVNFGSIRLEFLPRRYTGRSASDPIMFSVRGTLGVPLLEMQKGCPIDAGNDAAFPANWPDKTASWLLDYPGVRPEFSKYPESCKLHVLDATNRPLTRYNAAWKISKKICEILERVEMSGPRDVQSKWSLKGGQWRELRLVALVLYSRGGKSQVWVPILAEQS